MTEASKTPAPAQEFLIRPAVPDEVVLVESTWKRSFWRNSRWAIRIKWDVFARGHQKVIWNLLAKAQVLVAYDASRPEAQLGLGYIVFEPDAVHYLWVRESERGKGIARQLLEASGLPRDLDGVSITHPTTAWFSARATGDRPARRGLEARFPKSIHDPYRWMEV